MDTKETYNTTAEEWHKKHQSDDWWIEGTDTFVSLLPENGTVLDAGCAGGLKSRYLAGKGLQVTGFDFAENFIAIAKREVPEANFFVGDMREEIATDTQFDGVFSQASLLHIPKKDVNLVLKNLLKVLKSGGHLYVAVKEPYADQPEEEYQRVHYTGSEHTRFFSYFTLDELETLFQNLGLEVVYTKKSLTEDTTWLQIIGRK